MYKMLKDIWFLLGNHRKKLFLAYFLSLPMAGIKTFQTYLVKDIFDQGFSPDAPSQAVLSVAALLFFSQLLNHPIRYFHFYNLRVAIENFMATVRMKILNKIQGLPVSYFQLQKQGNVVSLAMNDTTLFSDAIHHSVTVIREPLTAVGLLSIALYHDWQLTLILVLTTPILIKIFRYSGKKVRHYGTLVQQRVGYMTQNVTEAITGQKVIKSFNLQDFSNQRFDNSLGEYLENKKKFINVVEHTHPLVETIGAFAIALIIVYAHHRVQDGALTAGAFISFFAAIVMFNDSLKKFSDANLRLSQARSAKDRIFNFLALEDEKNEGVQNISFQHSIEIQNLNFSYGQEPVLKNLNLKIEKGMKVGLVGLSGSGKSTLVNLLQRLYPVGPGQISIDGHDINEIDLESLRSQFALVSQDIFLFNDTIKENILCGQKIDEQKLKEALEVSYVSDFVDKLPQGLETIIGDRGIRLSGGQSQRLTIARAFLKDRPILLFDEATSALDNESERIVQKALEKVAGDKTVIAVAHRLSTIQSFDKIVVFKEGEKVEEGTHEQLMALSGEYRKLFELSQS